MAEGSETKSAICDNDELGGEETGSEVKHPWFPSLGGCEEDAEGVSGSKVRKFVGCGHGAGIAFSYLLAQAVKRTEPTDR